MTEKQNSTENLEQSCTSLGGCTGTKIELPNGQAICSCGAVSNMLPTIPYYFPRRSLAITFANTGQKQFSEKGVYNSAVQYEPKKGYFAVLFSTTNVVEAWELGYYVTQPQILPTTGADPDWAESKKTKKTHTVSTSASTKESRRPSRGKTLLAWETFDATGGTDRKVLIAAAVKKGIHPSTAATQYSKWFKEQKQS